MKQTAAEIDHAILDVAAGIFAARGFAHTSVQQIADAVGYSKPGLLHRFGHKESMYQGVLDEVNSSIDQVCQRSLALAGHPDRLPLLMETVFRMALARPGMAAMTMSGLEPSERRVPEQNLAPGMRLVDLFDNNPSSPMRRLRVVLALRLISNAAMTQSGNAGLGTRLDLHVAREELVPLIVGLAVSTMRGSSNTENEAIVASMSARLSAAR